MQVINALGRRKTAVARIYMKPGNGDVTINGRTLVEYFPTEVLQIILNQPFTISENLGKFDVKVNVRGGGIAGQAEAIRMAISRALCESDETNRPVLKKEGFLTRDSRMVERKKYGRAKARKRFQFSKR
ncbi:MAG: 30S ribosomal protein S9 [Spirosomataceae bacterium]